MMIGHLHLGETRRGLLLASGLLAGLAVALATAGSGLGGWEAGAAGLGLGLAALAGLAQTCSA
jgi:hypothetical protein